MDDKLRQRLKSQLDGLFAFAYTLTRREHFARDLVQETALKALSAKNVPENETAFRVWIFRILRNSWIDEVRRNGHEVALPDDLCSNIDHHAGEHERRLLNLITLKMGFERLSDAHREILALIDVAGLSYEEAAQTLSLPRGTVMSRVARARATLIELTQDATDTGVIRASSRFVNRRS